MSGNNIKTIYFMNLCFNHMKINRMINNSNKYLFSKYALHLSFVSKHIKCMYVCRCVFYIQTSLELQHLSINKAICMRCHLYITYIRVVYCTFFGTYFLIVCNSSEICMYGKIVNKLWSSVQHTKKLTITMYMYKISVKA